MQLTTHRKEIDWKALNKITVVTPVRIIVCKNLFLFSHFFCRCVVCTSVSDWPGPSSWIGSLFCHCVYCDNRRLAPSQFIRASEHREGNYLVVNDLVTVFVGSLWPAAKLDIHYYRKPRSLIPASAINRRMAFRSCPFAPSLARGLLTLDRQGPN